MIDGFQFRHGGQTPAAPGHGETLRPGLGLVPGVVRVRAHIPFKASDAVGNNPVTGSGKSLLGRFNLPHGLALALQGTARGATHTTNKIKVIRLKRYQLAIINPPGVSKEMVQVLKVLGAVTGRISVEVLSAPGLQRSGPQKCSNTLANFWSAENFAGPILWLYDPFPGLYRGDARDIGRAKPRPPES